MGLVALVQLLEVGRELFSWITQIEPFVGNVSKQGKGWEAPSRQAHWSSEVSEVKFEGAC